MVGDFSPSSLVECGSIFVGACIPRYGRGPPVGRMQSANDTSLPSLILRNFRQMA